TIDQAGAKTAPAGHPVHTFKEENRGLQKEIRALDGLYGKLEKSEKTEKATLVLQEIQARFNALMDVDKHYRRKENLLFPFLEKHGITGPPTVMWGKHDETREFLKAAQAALSVKGDLSMGEAVSLPNLLLRKASGAVEDMIAKEEEILFPMSLDMLTDGEWYDIDKQSLGYGFCLYDPQIEWKPDGWKEDQKSASDKSGRVRLPSGSLSVPELTALLNTIPFDMTFVDCDDTVRYFTQGRERIFARSRAIIGRKVQQCHPPSSVHVVEKILDDFKSGKEDQAAFWITLEGKFIHIEYFALRDPDGTYLGTLEVSQDLTEKRKLFGEQRLVQYGGKEKKND
ncbi:MAG: DUF438 domain-containing protein, partial [Candidatus Aminicenantes bacterium]|nr:DUF438 domain-containing protein [Candidatus Aminicenantes bacterium]